MAFSRFRIATSPNRSVYRARLALPANLMLPTAERCARRAASSSARKSIPLPFPIGSMPGAFAPAAAAAAAGAAAGAGAALAAAAAGGAVAAGAGAVAACAGAVGAGAGAGVATAVGVAGVDAEMSAMLLCLVIPGDPSNKGFFAGGAPFTRSGESSRLPSMSAR